MILLAAGHRDAAARHQHHAGGQGHTGQHMEHDRRIHLRVFQQAIGDHIRGALKDLLRRLELQLDGAFQFLFVGFEQLGCTQHHGCVHVVAAAVHPAGHLRGKVHAGLLLNGQSVHVAAQQNGLARLFAARQHKDACLAAVLRGVTHLSECLLDQRSGLGQVEAYLRVPVQGAPPVLQLGFQHGGFCHQFLRVHHFKSAPFFILCAQPVEWNFPQSCSGSCCVPQQRSRLACAAPARCGH